MNKEIFSKDNREAIRQLKDLIMKSELNTAVKCDFIEYINSEKAKALESLQKLVYDFLDASQALFKAKENTDITEWVHMVVNNLDPSIKDYSRKQIDLVIALILLEQSDRDSTYRDILNRFTEIYKNEGGVF